MEFFTTLEMGMRANEEIGIGEHLSPPLRPLAAVLHDDVLRTHCSACFAALPPEPYSPLSRTFTKNPRHVPTNIPSPLYCSLPCSAADSALHFSSAERRILSLFSIAPTTSWVSSSQLRLSLRLAHVFQNLPQGRTSSPQPSFLGGENVSLFRENRESEGPDGCLERIAGLMTNRENLINKTQIEGDKRIREGAKMMAEARGKDVNSEGFEFEEMVLCLVLTNAVEVQLKNGHCLGIAVYDTAFSWINHSCSPNSFYWFLVGPEDDEQLPLRTSPAEDRDGGDLIMGGGVSGRNGYGPRVVVQSVKAISKGEEVTITYTDLLRPKEMRQEDLWLKYRFSCSCERCCASPTSYVDNALQACSTGNPQNPEYSDNEIEKLMQKSAFYNEIDDYLSSDYSDDSKSCCKNLESLLCDGDYSDKSLEPKEAKSHWRVKIHPFHHISIDTYTTLASVYKVRASYELEGDKLEALNMYKTSCAYSLLLVGVVNHFYTFVPAIVTTAANFWINAGESLLNLTRSSLWDDAFPVELSSLLTTLKCQGGCVISSEPNTDTPDHSMNLEERKSQLYNCIATLTSEVWSFLSSQSNFLKFIQNPVDLRWLESPAALNVSDGDSQLHFGTSSDQVRMNLILLSIHCLGYGALLSSICYGLSVETQYGSLVDAIMKN